LNIKYLYQESFWRVLLFLYIYHCVVIKISSLIITQTEKDKLLIQKLV